MSIVTKTGDAGKTALMYNRRVAKCHARVEAYGAVDELNCAIGLARATAKQAFVRGNLRFVQEDLVVLMGELATVPEDLPRYAKDGYSLVTSKMTVKLDQWVRKLEAAKIAFRGWATPGANASAATLDLARSVCRRAERRVCALHEAAQLQNGEIIVYLNRLADVLWLLARQAEVKALRRRKGEAKS